MDLAREKGSALAELRARAALQGAGLDPAVPLERASSVTNELPPRLTNGNGTPVTGISRMFTPMLTNAWNRMNEAIPTAISRPNESSARDAMLMHRNSSVVNNANSTIAPTNPSSSAPTLNT